MQKIPSIAVSISTTSALAVCLMVACKYAPSSLWQMTPKQPLLVNLAYCLSAARGFTGGAARHSIDAAMLNVAQGIAAAAGGAGAVAGATGLQPAAGGVAAAAAAAGGAAAAAAAAGGAAAAAAPSTRGIRMYYCLVAPIYCGA